MELTPDRKATFLAELARHSRLWPIRRRPGAEDGVTGYLTSVSGTGLLVNSKFSGFVPNTT